MTGINHMDNNQPERKPDNVLFYTTGGTTFEIEEFFDGAQTYNDIVRNAIRREFEAD